MEGGAPAVQVNAGMSHNVETLIGMARLEAKLDVAIAHQGAKIETHGTAIDDHEVRIRAQEQKPTVSPMGLWSVVVGAISVFAAVAGVALRFILG